MVFPFFGEPTLDEAIQKASVLLEASSWIRQFRGRYVVIKLGGSALEQKEAVRSVLSDVLFMETVGMKPILIHGGGKAISQAMSEAGIEPRFVHGRRYTDEATLEIASRVLAQDICQSLVDEIKGQGGKATGLNFLSNNVLVGERLRLTGPNGEPTDLGAVGSVIDINREVLDEVCNAGGIPVIPSVALTRDGKKLNVNADTAAAAVAKILKAEKLVFLSDVPGIFLDKDDPETLIPHVEKTRCYSLIDDGTIAAGMVPKVEAALDAIDAGVRKVHIVDAAKSHSLLLEVYSNQGVGTEIVPDPT